MTLPTKLFHYSRNEVEKLVPEFYEKYKQHWPEEGSMKPCGLWISVEDDPDDHNWFDWCKGEQFRLESLYHKYAVTISEDAKILHLKTVEDIISFSLEYAANDPFDFARKSLLSRREYIYMIAWSRVKEKYDGMIISPYQWGARMGSETAWYYPWDCSSGCIWNLDKVKLKLHSIIDIEAITDKEELEEKVEEETPKDLLSEGLALLESSVRLVHKE